MRYEMFRRPMTPLGQAPPLSPGLRVAFWRPSLARPVHPRLTGPSFLAWSLCHFTRVFHTRDYGLVLVFRGDRLVHRTCLLPSFFRFPFLASGDLQAAGLWTDPELRGQGLALAVLALVLERLQDPGRTLWYMAEVGNSASIRVAEKAGFTRFGRVHRRKWLGLHLLGYFNLEETYGEG